MKNELLGKYIKEISLRNKSGDVVDVYSVTNSEGFINSIEYFKKEVFSKNIEAYKIVKNGQFAFNPSRINVGSIDYLVRKNEVVVSPLYTVFECSEKLDPEYLKLFLRSPLGNARIRAKTRGAVRDTLSFKSLANIKIIIPSLFSQQYIVNVLRKAGSIITQRKESIALLDKLLKSLFLEIFGDPVRNEREWELKGIEKLVKKDRHAIKRGPFGGALKKEIFVPKGHLVYEQYHALNNDFSFGRYFINEEKLEELRAFEVSPGDIIISCSGVYLGKLAIIPQTAPKGIINQALLKISLDEKIINKKFFVYLFSHDSFRRKFLGDNRGSGIPNFPPMEEFKKFAFIYPPFQLQNQFANLVEKIEALKASYKQSLLELENLYGALSQSAFKGELVKRQPS